MNDIRARQARYNAESRDQWEGFADHRRRVSSLLMSGSDPSTTRLCVLGAGNGNDLDLSSLLDAHREVHLVDLDPVALARGTAGQGVADHPRIHRHGGLDVTSMLEAIGGWSTLAPIADPDLLAMVEWPASRVGLALPGPFDVVASTCLLSQVIGNAFHSVGEDHPRFLEAVRAIRMGHLRLLVELARPGGLVILITDVVSSDRDPSLETIPEHLLPNLLGRLAANRGLIHGVNPVEILQTFRQDLVISPKVDGLEPVAPWRWKLHERQYLVWALKCRLRGRA